MTTTLTQTTNFATATPAAHAPENPFEIYSDADLESLIADYEKQAQLSPMGAKHLRDATAELTARRYCVPGATFEMAGARWEVTKAARPRTKMTWDDEAGVYVTEEMRTEDEDERVVYIFHARVIDGEDTSLKGTAYDDGAYTWRYGESLPTPPAR